MGDIADYYFNKALEEEFEYELNRKKLLKSYNKKKKIWKTKDGKELSIQEMSDSHLKNSLKMLLKNKKDNSIGIEILKMEIKKRKNIIEIKENNNICPNCKSGFFNGDCENCGFDATEIDIY